jgi:hypothetical protein
MVRWESAAEIKRKEEKVRQVEDLEPIQADNSLKRRRCTRKRPYTSDKGAAMANEKRKILKVDAVSKPTSDIRTVFVRKVYSTT